MVVWMSAWPIHSWTRRMSALAIMRVPNVWRRSMESERAKAGTPQSGVAAAAQRRSVEVLARRASEGHIVLAGPVGASSEAGQSVGDVGRHRHGTDLARLRCRQLTTGVAGGDSDRRSGEVDVSPPEREQLASAQIRERRDEEDRGVLLGGGAADEGQHLLRREHIDVAACALAVLFDRSHRV